MVYDPLEFNQENERIMRDNLNQHPEGWPVQYNELYHYRFFPTINAARGDIVFFYLPEITPKVVGNTVILNGVTYYVTAVSEIVIGTADPLIRIALLSLYPPPGIPAMWSYRWVDPDAGAWKIEILFGSSDITSIQDYEIYRSFDYTNWHYLTRVDTGPFYDVPPPLEHIWYKVRARSIYNTFSSFTAPMYFQAQWQRFFNNPVLTGTPATWDFFGVTCPNLWYNKTEQLIHMFYGGGTGALAGYQIGHATLTLNDWKTYNWTAWVKDPANPVMTPAGINFMQLGVFEPYLTFYNSQFIVFHTGYDNHNGGGMDAAGIGAYTGPTLWGPWTAVSTVTPRVGLGAGGTWDDFDVFAASVFLEGNTYHMWYSASNNPAQAWKIGRAYSTDPIGLYTKFATNPVLSFTGTDWEQSKVFFLRNVPHGTHLIGYYQGANVAGRFQWGTSWNAGATDTIHRTANNPDIRYYAGNEATLQIGGSLFKDPVTNRWTFFYGSCTFPVTVAEIRAAVLVPVMPL